MFDFNTTFLYNFNKSFYFYFKFFFVDVRNVIFY